MCYKKIIKKMDILRANKASTQQFTLKLQETKDHWRLARIEMKEKLVKIAADQVSKITDNTNTNTIGCPTDFCDELTKAKVEYQEMVLKEMASIEKVMEDYVQVMVGNMNIDSVTGEDSETELKIYKKYMDTPMQNWAGMGVQFSPGQGWNYQNTGEFWRQQITLKLRTEKNKLESRASQPVVPNETKTQEDLPKKKKKIVRRKKKVSQ